MTRIERMMAEVLLLQDCARNCEQLATAFKVSKRTVIRDMQSLCEMGVPVVSRDGVGGGYSLLAGYQVKPLELTWQEALLLMMALDSLTKLSDSPFSAERGTLVAKLRDFIPRRHLERLKEMRDKLTIEIPERNVAAPILNELVPLVETGEWIELEYDSVEGITNRVIRPDRIYTDRGFWYLIGFDGTDSKNLRVDRIGAVRLTQPPPEILEPIPYDDARHPLVTVRLTKRGARALQRDPHLGGLVDTQISSQILEFRCPPSELEWYSSFFGGLGDDAIVLSPSELRAKIGALGAQLSAIYKNSKKVGER